MKKSLIAVAGASVAAAAMPVMGVFAAGELTSTSFTDVVKVSVGSSCTIIPAGGTVVESDTTDQSGNRTVVLEDRVYGPYTLMQGHYISNIGGNQIAEDTDDPEDAQGSTPASAATIVCSAGTGDVAPGEGSTQANGSWVLTAIGAGDGAVNTSMQGATAANTIPTGTWSEGASVWQYKVIGTNATTYSAIPSSETNIAQSTTSGGSVTISPRYRVSASASQAEDTYTGKVTYTLIYAAE